MRGGIKGKLTAGFSTKAIGAAAGLAVGGLLVAKFAPKLNAQLPSVAQGTLGSAATSIAASGLLAGLTALVAPKYAKSVLMGGLVMTVVQTARAVQTTMAPAIATVVPPAALPAPMQGINDFFIPDEPVEQSDMDMDPHMSGLGNSQNSQYSDPGDFMQIPN